MIWFEVNHDGHWDYIVSFQIGMNVVKIILYLYYMMLQDENIKEKRVYFHPLICYGHQHK